MARLGKTDLNIYPLGLGGIPLMKLTLMESRAVIDAAIDGGINIAETGEGYGDSEEKLSWALRRGRDKFVIASKSPHRSAKEMEQAIDQSLTRLQTDFVDIYQIHALKSDEQLERIMAPGGAMEALAKAREQGKIRFVGVTGHRPAVLVKAIKTGLFETVQVPVNVVDREAEGELLPLARELDVGILAMKPVCGGTLDDPVLGIRFCLNAMTDVVLVGMKNVAEVETNLETARSFRPLGELEEDELLEQARQLGQQFCRRCEYCQPCPNGIHIPRILWLSNYHHRAPERDAWTEEEYRSLNPDASACEQCGECEEKCPYDLPIREMLEQAHAELTPSAKLVARRRVKKVVKKILPIRKSID